MMKCEADQAFSLFLNKFNNTGARMLHSNYQMTVNYYVSMFFLWENFYILPNIRDVVMSVFHNVTKICKPLVGAHH